MGETPYDDANELHHDHDELLPTTPGLDPELQFEERYGKVIAENGNLQRENSQLEHQLRTLEVRFDRLQDSKVGSPYILILDQATKLTQWCRRL